MRLRLVAALSAATLAIVVPGAISGEPSKVTDDVPSVAVPLQLPGQNAPKSQQVAAAPKRSVPPTPKAPAPQVSTPREQASTVEAKTPRLVREWHVLHTRQADSGETSDASPCPRPSTCDRYELKPARWPTDPSGAALIPFAYNDDGRRPARADDGMARPALAAAMSEWSRFNSNVVFRDTGTTTAAFGADGKDGTCDDGTNVITWRTFAPDVIGAAVLCFDEAGKVVRDADLALNATQHWERVSGTPESRHSHDIQSIYTHELGHWIAFEDIYNGDATRQTMFGNTEYGEMRKRTLALGDVVGLQKAYPCGSGDRCPRSGIIDD